MRARTGSLLAVAALLLGGCGGGSSSDASSTPTTDAAPAWNPCDGVDLAAVQEVLGGELTLDRGTETSPRCALVPATSGDAVVDVNYLVFPEGLDAAWDAMGAPDDGSVIEPAIDGADAARVVASAGSEALGVTGFVQNGALIQVVNVVDTPPYDRRAAVAAVRVLLTQLSAHTQDGGAPQ